MIKPINAILFATDLSPQCQQAYEFAVAMGIRNKALVYILYILEEMPESIESRIQGLVGRHQWQDLMQTKREDVHKSLTGKRLSSQVLQEIQISVHWWEQMKIPVILIHKKLSSVPVIFLRRS